MSVRPIGCVCERVKYEDRPRAQRVNFVSEYKKKHSSMPDTSFVACMKPHQQIVWCKNTIFGALVQKIINTDGKEIACVVGWARSVGHNGQKIKETPLTAL